MATVSLVLFILPSFAWADSGWDDFTNNLATDLAPLITLFGESVTKQFLSESLDWLDNLIFALAPIGIITTVVSAIRVCGNSTLRAFIGRAQEGPGDVEIELLSSTSETVAELWNEEGIARVFGSPKLLEVVTWNHKSNYQNGWPNEEPTYSAGIDLVSGKYLQGGHDIASLTHPKAYAAPNLSINKGIKALTRKWFYSITVLGIFLQTGKPSLLFAPSLKFSKPIYDRLLLGFITGFTSRHQRHVDIQVYLCSISNVHLRFRNAMRIIKRHGKYLLFPLNCFLSIQRIRKLITEHRRSCLCNYHSNIPSSFREER